jgi:hypothetical protein
MTTNDCCHIEIVTKPKTSMYMCRGAKHYLPAMTFSRSGIFKLAPTAGRLAYKYKYN